MKKLTALLFLIFSLLTVSLFAQSSDERAVAGQVEALRKAMIAGDKAVLNDVLADQLSYGQFFGPVNNKGQFIDALVSGQIAFTRIDLKDQRIVVDGNTAVVRHKFIADTNDKGKINNITIGVMQVWKKINNKWQLYARQGYKL
ncbi:nuclear transport factor 2 family protein [Mucilaginibacter sp. dw_454]|uniref:nuclear transport factor 2 family protein n=1 Tax=Mucilaginibacter sp. dw_454 TaxID=2720079 RepID=UPI001BD26CA9|nr:nuclear transport factor 2 family protein [Mucilaginibacter sp. dw_454]